RGALVCRDLRLRRSRWLRGWSCCRGRRGLLRSLSLELAQCCFQRHHTIFQIAQALFHRSFVVSLCRCRTLWLLRCGSKTSNQCPENEDMKMSQMDPPYSRWKPGTHGKIRTNAAASRYEVRPAASGIKGKA